MPEDAYRSGHSMVMFDLSEVGKLINVKIIKSTQSIFDRPTIESVEKWVYSESTKESDPDSRINLTTKVSYILVDEYGNVIPE